MNERQRRENRELAGQHWPELASLMTSYFNQNFNVLYGSLDGAFEAAFDEGSVEHRRLLLREWRSWNQHFRGRDIRDFLLSGFGVAVRFRKSDDAWELTERVYEGLLSRVRKETSHAN